jgi:pyrroloquinoline quinone biosynthesis protein D
MIPADARPRLVRGVRLREDKVRGGHNLLAPERVLRMNGSSAAILSLCDGARSFDEIVAELSARHDAEPGRIAQDAGAFLETLLAKKMLEL